MEQEEVHTSQSLKDKAYKHIKKEIITGAIKPGSIIDEKEYIQILQISRTPIREALVKLSEEGLVNIIARRSITVSYIQVKDIIDIYDIRKTLEPLAIERIKGKVDKEKLLAFKNAFNNIEMISSTSDGQDLDSEFHLYLAQCTQNKVLINTEEILMCQSQRMRALSSISNTHMDKVARDEHIQIIDYLLADNFEAAKKICIQHLEGSLSRYQKLFTNNSFFTL